MLGKKVKVTELLPSPWETGRKRVILIHGLFLCGLFMKPVAKALMGKGFSPLLYDYPTARHTVERHGEILADFLQSSYFRKAEENSYRETTDFVTHSMGGLILRKALSLLPPAHREKIGNIVMIAPPNRGSDVAEFFLRVLPFPSRYIKPLEGLSSSAASYANKSLMPEEFYSRTGILGAEDDLMVKREYTAHSGISERVFLPGHHTPILFTGKTKEAVHAFLRNGAFPPGLKRD